jgi:hypothetical protein
VSVSTVLYPRWPPLQKIEISSNDQNCSILSQNVPKFKMYKHNDELFNMYYRIFLWTLNFCQFWPIMQMRKKGGWNLKKIFSETTEPISTKLCWNDSWMAPFHICVRWSRLPTKMAAKLKIEKRGDEILIVHCCFSVNQNELKFNCSYMARSSLTYIPGFPVKFFFMPIYTNYAN